MAIAAVLTKYKKGIIVGEVTIRLATTLSDATVLSRVIRGAWGLSDGKKPYFYALFNNPQELFETVLQPSLSAKKFRDIQCLSFVAVLNKKVVGTGSLVFDHADKTIEFGRDATDVKFQGNEIHKTLTKIRADFLKETNHDYAIISDSTTLTLSVQKNLHYIDLPTVSFHPSSFIIQKENVVRWKNYLLTKHPEEIAEAILIPSSKTGLGRFATFYHVLLSKKIVSLVKQPVLPEFLNAFYNYTTKKLGVSSKKLPQKNSAFTTKIKDNPLTATRLVVIGKSQTNPQTLLQRAEKAGFDTLIVQIPCDTLHKEYHQKLVNVGFILGGVFPNTKGMWLASYVFILDNTSFQLTLTGLKQLAKYDYNHLTISHNVPLVTLVMQGMEKSQAIRQNVQ